MKNIFLITVDSLRADHLGCYGYGRNTSPNIDKLAKEGLLFKQAVANGQCTPVSFPVIICSQYPRLFEKSFNFRPKDAKMIQEALSERDYQTAAFLSNPYISSFFGYDRGFDLFEDFLNLSHKKIKRGLVAFIKKRFGWVYSPMKKIYAKIRISRGVGAYENADVINKRVVEWLEKDYQGKAFVWIHYMDVHTPYIPSKKCLMQVGAGEITKNDIKEIRNNISKIPDYLKEAMWEKIIGLYDAEIRFVDDKIGWLIEYLKEKKIYDDSLIILTSDHGEELFDHGGFVHPAKLYDELLHIPLIIISPEIESAEIETPVSQLDIAPTIISLIDGSREESFEGEIIISKKGRYDGREDKFVMSVCSINEENKIDGEGNGSLLVSCRSRKLKLIYNEKTQDYEGYDLINDPKEERNIYQKKLDTFLVYKEKIHEFIGEMKVHKGEGLRKDANSIAGVVNNIVKTSSVRL